MFLIADRHNTGSSSAYKPLSSSSFISAFPMPHWKQGGSGARPPPASRFLAQAAGDVPEQQLWFWCVDVPL